jgi:SAM-dependent methyltransferase
MGDLREAWEDEAQDWLAWARTPGHDAWFWRFNWPAFARLLPPAGPATLDLGCGEGRAGRLLAETGHRLTGVDGSPTLAALARDAGGYEDVVVADAAALPFTDGAFDLVVAFMSLQDVDDLDGALAESGRVLAPGGRLCVAVLHPAASSELVEDRFASTRFTDTIERRGLSMTFHGMHHTLERYVAAFRDGGFVVEDLREPAPDAELVRELPEVARALQRPQFLHLLARRG